jgi:hypothetical protein
MVSAFVFKAETSISRSFSGTRDLARRAADEKHCPFEVHMSSLPVKKGSLILWKEGRHFGIVLKVKKSGLALVHWIELPWASMSAFPRVEWIAPCAPLKVIP